MLLLSLLTGRIACLSMRRGAVQRPLKPGDSLSYTSLRVGVVRKRAALLTHTHTHAHAHAWANTCTARIDAPHTHTHRAIHPALAHTPEVPPAGDGVWRAVKHPAAARGPLRDVGQAANRHVLIQAWLEGW
jgi:hypothetical protein